MDGVRKSIYGIGVVERLGTECLVKKTASLQRSTVVNIGIRLDNPDKLFARVVEVELDLVGRRTDRFITSELKLLDQVLVGVLGHLAALICVKEDVVNIERSGNKRLLVGSGNRYGSGTSSHCAASPEALTNRTEVNVDLDLVVLKSNQGKSKSGVAAKSEKKGNIESGLRKGLARGTDLSDTTSGTGTRDISESRVSDVCKLSGVTNHLVVTSLLLLGKSKLVPDVHPVTVLTVNALTTNLDLNLGNKLLTDEVQPTGIDITRSHRLVDLGKSNLKIGTVSKITITADCACYTAAEIGLTGEGLLNGFHGKVCVASVRHLPESNLRGSSKEHVLCAIGDELH